MAFFFVFMAIGGIAYVCSEIAWCARMFKKVDNWPLKIVLIVAAAPGVIFIIQFIKFMVE